MLHLFTGRDTSYLQSLVTSNHSRLGISLVVSILVALWSALYGTMTLMESLNVIYEEQEKRGTYAFTWFPLR